MLTDGVPPWAMARHPYSVFFLSEISVCTVILDELVAPINKLLMEHHEVNEVYEILWDPDGVCYASPRESFYESLSPEDESLLGGLGWMTHEPDANAEWQMFSKEPEIVTRYHRKLSIP